MADLTEPTTAAGTPRIRRPGSLGIGTVFVVLGLAGVATGVGDVDPAAVASIALLLGGAALLLAIALGRATPAVPGGE